MNKFYRTAIKALEFRKAAIIVNANLHDEFLLNIPMCKNASKENKAIDKAIEYFKNSDKQMEINLKEAVG